MDFEDEAKKHKFASIEEESGLDFSSMENTSSQVTWKPEIGMQFDNPEAAWDFWVTYGAKIGFGVRRHWSNKCKKTGKITSYRFVCCKEGCRKPDKRDYLSINPRLETRTNCPARMSIKYEKESDKYLVHDFVEQHNHVFHLTETTHMLVCQRKLSEVQAYEIDLADATGIKQKASFELMSAHVGGRSNLGFTQLDQKNYLRSKRQKNLIYGEAGGLLQYFREQLLDNPSFYYALQLDMEEQITNIFWADAKMIMDYDYFGDVITFDTTYSTNNAYRPLAVFTGFNHYRGAVIFGASLLYDETVESFKWLFETFLEAHKKKKPATIFTDQDHAISKTLLEVMPETYHGLCTWHLMQNGIKHLGNMMKNGSSFLQDFRACMYEFEDEEHFKMAWDNLLQKYNAYENSWLKSVFKLKEKWARCYMSKAFSLGMQSTQLSESLNSDLKSCLTSDLNILQFFKNFEKVVRGKRYKELECEFVSRQILPRLKLENSPILQQAAEVYTYVVFDLFQKEYDLYSAACIKYRDESKSIFEYVVTLIDREGEYKVLFDPFNLTISCSCKKFETFGLLCCHALKIFDVKDIKLIPMQYVLKRWTKEGRNGLVQDARGRKVQDDVNLDSSQRYKQLCPKLIKLATKAADCLEAFSFVDKVVDDLSKQVDNICDKQMSVDKDKGSTLSSASKIIEHLPQQNSIETIAQKVKGFKKRFSQKGKRRLQSWVEKQSKRKRKAPSVNTLQNPQLKEPLDNSVQLMDEMMSGGSQPFADISNFNL